MSATLEAIRARQMADAAAAQAGKAKQEMQSIVVSAAKERVRCLIDDFNETTMRLRPFAKRNGCTQRPTGLLSGDKWKHAEALCANGMRFFLMWHGRSLLLVNNAALAFSSYRLVPVYGAGDACDNIGVGDMLDVVDIEAVFNDPKHAFNDAVLPIMQVGAIREDGTLMTTLPPYPSNPVLFQMPNEWFNAIVTSDWVAPFVDLGVS